MRVNVRILATTNRDLPAEVARGQFREDLYFRLERGSAAHPAAARAAAATSPPLAEHFARRYAEVNGLPCRPLSPLALARLTAHAWRGNVRELENAIHRAVLLATGDAIGAEAIELHRRAGSPDRADAPPRRGGVAALVGRSDGRGRARPDPRRRCGHTLGNRTHAATILGISIRALRNKLRDYAAQGARGAAAGRSASPPDAG